MADTTYLKDNLTGFVPTPIAAEIIADVVRGSSVMRLSTVQPMESETKKFPVMVSGPGAYWVGETERIQTSVAQWIFPELVAKKIGVIIPVSKEKLEDTTIDVFSTVKPYIAEAFYKAIDAACLFGTNSPFAKNIVGVATAGKYTVTEGTNKQLDLDISDVMAKVEDNGLDVDGFVAGYDMKNSLRKLRDANGNQLYVQDVDQNTLYAQPIEFCRNGAWDATKARAIAGNWKYSIIGIRDQIQYETLREATLTTITMEDSKPLSLAENDMVAIKATMRLGFLPVKETAFAVLAPKTTTSTAG
ncbi:MULTISPECIES: phage major capsid protein [unclassified Megasphaera]|uniref:phage major capsid protein n=1 Tax=unclassified Megasphaera TaxID=2626256 RepID=UPI000EB9E956|nr:phage major capsid protein [Megasphaera sp. UBA4233]HAM03916.1 phage major capsid protein [Megasphaera sp.]